MPSLFFKMSGAMGETTPTIMGEYRHSCLRCPRHRGHNPCPWSTAIYWGKRVCLGPSKAAEKIEGLGEDLISGVQGLGAGLRVRGSLQLHSQLSTGSQDVWNLLILASVSPKCLFFKIVPQFYCVNISQLLFFIPLHMI